MCHLNKTEVFCLSKMAKRFLTMAEISTRLDFSDDSEEGTMESSDSEVSGTKRSRIDLPSGIEDHGKVFLYYGNIV